MGAVIEAVMYESRAAMPWYQSNDLDQMLADAEIAWAGGPGNYPDEVVDEEPQWRTGFQLENPRGLTQEEHMEHLVEQLVYSSRTPYCRCGQFRKKTATFKPWCALCHDAAVEAIDGAYAADIIDWECYHDALEWVHGLAGDNYHAGTYKGVE